MNPDNFDRFGDFKVLERQFPDMEDTMTTDDAVERLAGEMRGAAFREVGYWDLPAKAWIAAARRVLAQRKPEDVEAVAKLVHDAQGPSPTEDYSWYSWESLVAEGHQGGKRVYLARKIARAIIAAYGPPPAPHELTDEVVERCAVAYQAAYAKWSGGHRAGLRACLTTFLTPEPAPVDPRIAVVMDTIDGLSVDSKSHALRTAKRILSALDAAGDRP
jgi:hypothetical protein